MALSNRGETHDAPPLPKTDGRLGAGRVDACHSAGKPAAFRRAVTLPGDLFHLYHGDVHPKTGKPSETLVSTHVSIRNTDPGVAMKVSSARYYNTEGKLLREFLSKPQAVPPLGTYELYVPRSDSSGGSGANFIIEWSAEKPINPPIVEALHADIREARTLLFVTTARPIQKR
jgi:hypothetical protein